MDQKRLNRIIGTGKILMSLKYRPEIDGLRAIAVISVVIYHCDIFFNGSQFASGGFLGVDIFFVISGYLITKIVNDEISARNFRYAHFYDRRIKRLLPAFISVTLFSTVLGYLFLTADALKEFSGSVLAATGFSSNFYFWLLDDYVAEPSKFKPFLHTWSLGIEEQFYFILPPLLWGLYSILRKHVREIFLIIVVTSFVFSIYWSRSDPRSAFFLIPSRAWELGVGSLIALYGLRLPIAPATALARAAKSVLPLVGLGLILGSVAFINDSMPHPSELTALSVLGTALIIMCAGQSDIVGKLLSMSVVRWVGLVSYSFYLWHWPVIVFSKFQTFVSLPLYMWALLSLVLASISYYAIEKPLRYGSRSVSYSFIGFGIALIVGFHTYSWISNGIPQRRGDSAKVIIDETNEAARIRASAIRIPQCHLRNEATVVAEECNHISQNKPNVIVAGDSWSADLFISLQAAYPEYNFIQFTGAGCSFYRTDLLIMERKMCHALWQQVDDYIQANRDDIDLFIDHGRRVDRTDWDALAAMVQDIPTLIVLQRAEITPNPQGTLETMDLQYAPELDNLLLQDKYSLAHPYHNLQSIKENADRLGFKTMDINEFVFPNGHIPFFANNGDLNFIDYAHWSVGFGKEVAFKIQEKYPDLVEYTTE
jgi:peptidoglycan/LPS O-acetylase OafA/YrhL